jgi:SAC3 family protein LENG8/THP3
VRHALAVQRALAIGNYHALFKLYLNAENMGAYIMDHFIERERIRALLCLSKACVLLSVLFTHADCRFDMSDIKNFH